MGTEPYGSCGAGGRVRGRVRDKPGDYCPIKTVIKLGLGHRAIRELPVGREGKG